MNTLRKPRKLPKQQRAKQTVAAILQATAHILREDGTSGFSTNKVAKRAGVSIGSLYQYFPNKDALIMALAEAHSGEQVLALAQNIGIVGDAPIEVAARRFVEATVRVHRDDPQLHIVLTSEVLARGIDVSLLGHQRGRALAAAWLRTRDDVDVEDPDITAFILVGAVEAAVHTALLEDPAMIEDPRFVDGLVSMVVRTLGAG